MRRCQISPVLLFVFAPLVWTCPAVEDPIQQVALERAFYYEKNAGHSTLAFRELGRIIQNARGNYENLLQVVEAVYGYGSNTPVLVALGRSVSSHREPVEHFDELLRVAAEHKASSVEVERSISNFVRGRISYEEFVELVRPYM